MSSYEEAKAQVEALWTKEQDDLAAAREAVGRRASEAWQSAEEGQRRAAVLSEQLQECRSELAALPQKMATAQLEDDQGEILALQGRYSALVATAADQDQALEAEHARIGEATRDLQAAEASTRDLAVKENALKASLWEQYESLDTALLHHFARSIQADRLPTFIAHEREAYVAAIRRQAQRLGKPEPGGIVVKNPSPNREPEPIVVRPGQLAPRG